MTPSIVHAAVFARCSHIVTSYRRDLEVHDLDEMHRYPETPFLHYARECGTHMITLHTDDQLPAGGVYVPYLFGTANREHIVEQAAEMARAIPKNGTSKMVQYFNGTTTREITEDRAIEIAEEYTRSTLLRWENERQQLRKAA